ncbi:MAG: ATP-binding cassette domain-containing protein [Chloroflexi bacterium]|nr:ATP-binding cassette domain-containing protein [Chloroflexota bacterium]MCI0575605.1 ATP-binding cassette domain-containing protein [Chloroflexota bacterium]MCI0645058.1 ATP-binding cassette domain-containing protein [Chloroflexota bacterium]MCI0731894.1 ATP-binding cassette domain-containing protein [Chloroflexota bacterium]
MSIILENLTKRYDSHPVVNNVSLEVADGEFFVLLGSSGSGKTTILTMIAGLVAIDQGRVLLHGRDVTHLPTQGRRVGFVFQHYALFQHMTVADNIEFGLRVRKVAAAERRIRRDELLELVGLAGLGNRMPRQLSGGQQQRVALARALAHRPDVLLLDEPLGALDAKIRVELRRTLKAIQRELGIAAILVTHDQEEAFELADRLGVMSFGRLLEVGAPEELYRQPQTEFVATFLGTANLLVGQATPGGVQVGPHHFPLPEHLHLLNGSQRVQLLFRPEDVALAGTVEELDCPSFGRGEVEQITFGGFYERLRLRLPPIRGVRPIAPPVAYGRDAMAIEVTRAQDQANRFPLQPGQLVWVGVRQIHALSHPGLRFLIPSDGSPEAQVALAIAHPIARLSHGRVTLLGHGLTGEALQRHLQETKEQLGSGLAALETRTTTLDLAEAVAEEVEHHPVDLVVLPAGAPETRSRTVEAFLQTGEHHLLLVPGEQALPEKALICIATGEPGKEDVLFAGRLLRHLGAEATLLSILPRTATSPHAQEKTSRFLESGIRTLEMLGVPARLTIRTGRVAEEIVHEMEEGGHDLLVLGAPLTNRERQLTLDGVTGQVLNQALDHPILIVRSFVRIRYEPFLRAPKVRTTILKEIIF